MQRTPAAMASCCTAGCKPPEHCRSSEPAPQGAAETSTHGRSFSSCIPIVGQMKGCCTTGAHVAVCSQLDGQQAGMCAAGSPPQQPSSAAGTGTQGMACPLCAVRAADRLWPAAQQPLAGAAMSAAGHNFTEWAVCTQTTCHVEQEANWHTPTQCRLLRPCCGPGCS